MTLILIALAAAAQPAADGSAKETRRMVDDYGRCIIERQHRRASEAILAGLSNSELMRRYPRLIDGTCMRAALRPGQVIKVRFTGDHYRYALADALVRRDLAAAPAPVLDAVPRLTHHEPAAPSRVDAKGRPVREKDYQAASKSYEEGQAFAFLSRFGECVVRVDPAAAKSLLLTTPESAEEAAQFSAMRDAFGRCLPEGRTIEFGKLALRGTLAVNYYRLAHAAGLVSAGARK